MRRVLCVWLPMWPIDRLRRALRTQGSSAAPPQAEPRPFALVETGAHGLEIAAANACARAGGVQPGMAHADARALSPNLASRPIDRDADVKALTALALWCRRYTPWTQTDGCDGLKLDITGCAHLFGGEEALMRDLSMRLTRLGCQHALGLADTRAAARALARFASSAELSTRINPPGETRATLAPLPAVGLDLDADTLRLLRRLGLRTIGQLLDLSRTGLGRRFQSADAAKAVLTRLDEMFAERGDPFSPLAPPPVRHVRLACAESLETLDAVRVGLERLAPQLCALLGNAGEGVRRAAFQICRVDGSAARICVGAARPTHDPSHLLRLFAEKLERLDPGFGVDLLILDAEAVERIEAGAQSLQDLADGRSDDAEAFRFADRLAARFGSRSVRRLTPCDSWTPERAEAALPADAEPEPWGEARATPPRPLQLFDRPEPAHVIAEVPDGPPARFTWRRVRRRVVRAQGPERIAPEWWSDPGARARARDYYAVEDEHGRRYWLFREGLYDAPSAEAPPSWFVHGLFP